MTWVDLRRVALIVWCIISTFFLFILVSPFVLDANWVSGVVPECAWKKFGKECALCGMTRSFFAISKGLWRESLQMNRGALPLYLTFLSNELFFFIFLTDLVIIKTIRRREA